MDLGLTKRPDCDGCKKSEAGFIVLGNHALCHPCSKIYRAREMVELIRNSFSKEELSSMLGGSDGSR